MSGRPAPPRMHQLRTATRGDPDRSDGSRTITIEDPEDDDEGEGSSTHDAGVLRLRGGPGSSQRVTWQDGTVDNEFLNRKKSKICCIYHKAKPKNFKDPFADSSSDSSSGGDDDSETDGDDESQGGEGKQEHGGDDTSDTQSGNATTNKSTTQKKHRQKHKHGSDCSHAKAIPPNAYEHQPTYTSKSKKGKTSSKGSSTMTVTQTEEVK